MQNLTVSKTFTSQFFPQQKSKEFQLLTAIIKSNKPTALPTGAQKFIDAQGKSLLFYAAHQDNVSSMLQLLVKGLDSHKLSKNGQSIGHVCAYGARIDTFRCMRNYQKLIKIAQIHKKMFFVLSNKGIKKNMIKKGHCCLPQQQKYFNAIQEQLNKIYENYLQEHRKSIQLMLCKCNKQNLKNSFHYVCLNKFTKCTKMLQILLDQFQRFQFEHQHLQNHSQWDGSLDYRLYEDTLDTLRQLLLPQKLNSIHQNHNKESKLMLNTALQAKDIDKATPLQIASKNGTTKMISLIRLKLKLNLDLPALIKVANNDLSRSHLMDLCQATQQNDVASMNFLISCGEGINKKKSIFGTFPLLQAVKSYSGSVEPFKVLLRSGADVNQEDTSGWTVMHHACNLGLIDVIDQLFSEYQHGNIGFINLNKTSSKGYHILHIAASSNHFQIIKYLLNSATAKKLKIDSSIKDSEGCTMLHHAAKKGSLDSVKIILSIKPSCLMQADKGSNTALHLAAMNNHYQCIRYLLYFDSDSNQLIFLRNSRGKLAENLCKSKDPFQNIFYAVQSGDINLTHSILTKKPKLLNVTTIVKRHSLLIIAAIHRQLSIVRILCELGAKKDHRDVEGKSALDYAEKNIVVTKQDKINKHKIIQLLKEHKNKQIEEEYKEQFEESTK